MNNDSPTADHSHHSKTSSTLSSCSWSTMTAETSASLGDAHRSFPTSSTSLLARTTPHSRSSYGLITEDVFPGEDHPLHCSENPPISYPVP